MNLTNLILLKNATKQPWILHDGPPYANGNIHIGHALNKVLKDIILRYKNSQNYFAPYLPGFDTHGLPIEWALMKQGKNIDPNLDPVTKRNNCKEFAQSQIEIQIEQFKRLGLMSNFKDYYATFDHDFEIRQLKIFLNFIEKKLVYRALKPVY